MTRIAPEMTPGAIVPMASLLPAESVALPPAPQAPSAPVQGVEARPGRQDKTSLDRSIAGARQIDPKASFEVDTASNAITFVSGSFAMNVKPGAAGQPADVVATEFLRVHGGLFGIQHPGAQLRLIGSRRDSLGMNHFKYQQFHNDLPVFGQQLVVHAKDAVVQSVNGRLTPNVTVADPATALSANEAYARAIQGPGTGLTGGQWKLGSQATTLGIFTTDDGAPHLAYEMDIVSANGPDRWRFYVDATNGKVLDRWSTIHSAMNRETYDARGGQSRPGKLARREGDGPTGDQVADAAHDHSAAVYEYFKEQFNRDSIDDRGMKLVSTVHFGNRYNNAFWDGSQMTYGDGDGDMFIPFALALDVVGHEMTHGITERTAGLQYRNQSGALNESWSDVFGNLIEKWDEERKNPGAPERDPKWLVGEEIFTPKIDGDGLRSMSAPGTGYARDPQPAHMKDYKNTTSDNGGVHINSGIPNKAAYEVAKVIGRDKLGAIWYRAQTEYLTSTSKFIDAANVTVQAAADLYGASSAEVQAVASAWDRVGLAPTRMPTR